MLFCSFQSLWKEYEKISFRLRRATARQELTCFAVDREKVAESKSIIQEFLYSKKSKRRLSGDTDLMMDIKLDAVNVSNCFDEAINIVSSLPNPDHSLVLSSCPHQVGNIGEIY